MEVPQADIDKNASDDENEMNLINIRKRATSKKIIDSDSDSEPTIGSVTNNNSPEKDIQSENDINIAPQVETQVKTTLKRIALIDTDSEDEEESAAPNDKKSNCSSENLENIKTISRYNFDSDSDQETKGADNNPSEQETVTDRVIYTTNYKGELIAESNTAQKSRLSALCDSESSDEGALSPHDEDESASDVKANKKKSKLSPIQVKEQKPKRMTGKEAAKQRIEIQSDSQKRIREKNVSLPYHKPKSYTIKEFLEKRSKLPSAIPLLPKAPPSIAIKMSRDRLEEISKKLDERMKEVEEFYKSESEDDDEIDNDKEKEETTKEIRSWLDALVISAIDTAEEKDKPQDNEETQDNSNKEPESIEYDFNLDNLEGEPFEEQVPSIKKPILSELLKDKLNSQPKLSGCSTDVIDLETGTSKPSAINKLVEKFFQHTSKKHQNKHKVKLDIVGVNSGGEILKETVSMEIDDEEEPAIIETPGAKLQKLREELQNQMALKRSEMWKQKQEQGDTVISSMGSEKKKIMDQEDDPDYEHDILDDEEEEFEMTESSSEGEAENDEDLEENDVDISENKRVKSDFVDDEADESDAEDDKEDIDDADEEQDDDKASERDIDEYKNDEDVEQPKKKVLKRIVQKFVEESDDDDNDNINNKMEESVRLDATASCDDDAIPPNLPKTPQRVAVTEKSESDVDFITPVSYLTGLQNLDSKFFKDSGISPFRKAADPSPLKDKNWQANLQKKLFIETTDESSQSQTNLDELADICSGKFPENSEMMPCTQDLLNVCSGGFTSEISGTNSELQKTVNNNESIAEIKNLGDDQDQIISQLLDEAELERFKKKFETPVKNSTNDKINEVNEVHATGLIDSDDEIDALAVKMKKKKKKLAFSDDEDSESEIDDVEENEEEINLHDDVEYDSEENEIPSKAVDFFEAEAELSGSEWDSADEDENDLDRLELNEADKEVFDEEKIRSDIERLHMRQILDDDNRELKLMQELLLEDGELHGTGRQRQFRWRNIDSIGNEDDDGNQKQDDDVFLDEEESEEQWRKMRHQREMFLKEKESRAMPDDVESILSDSQIFKVGQIVVGRSQSSGSAVKDKESEKETFGFLTKRGSFLDRKDNVLQRLATYTKIATTSTIGTATAKNSRSFVFQTVESHETTTSIIKENHNKRKAVDGTPNAIKRLRLTSEFSPLVSKKKNSNSTGIKAKLF